MRKVSTTIANLLASNDRVDYFLLAKIELAPTILACSLPYSVTYNGEVYGATASVVAFGPPRVSTSVDRETYELVLADPNNELQSNFRSGVTGAGVTIYAGFVSAAGTPYLGADDVFIAYKGYIDTTKILRNEDSKLATIQASSPMGSLDATGGYIASKDGMRQVNPSDTSFDEIFTGGKAVTIKWGKD